MHFTDQNWIYKIVYLTQTDNVVQDADPANLPHLLDLTVSIFYCKELHGKCSTGPWIRFPLHKIPKFHLILWYRNFVESFCRALGNSPKPMRKLCLSTKFPHQDIRWNFGILRILHHSIFGAKQSLHFVFLVYKLYIKKEVHFFISN